VINLFAKVYKPKISWKHTVELHHQRIFSMFLVHNVGGSIQN